MESKTIADIEETSATDKVHISERHTRVKRVIYVSQQLLAALQSRAKSRSTH